SRIKFGGHWFLNRECVAYAAWKRWSKGLPFDTIDAGDWRGKSQDPTVGSVAIWNRGTVGRYGHVAYVTAISRDSITVSEFNWRPWAHSLRTIPRASGGWPSRFWN
ncbi:MAG: CHAP domain-containing protein, partial [Elusimicrobiota bacterium]